MITDDLRNKRVTVSGLGRFGGGIAVSRWLVEHGASVLVTDRESAEKLAGSVKQLDGLPITFRLGEHRKSDFTDTDLVVTSPAIPPTNEFIRAAMGAGVPVTTEIRLFIERCPAKIIGVTATKGKSTTTKLLSLILESRDTVWTGGNLGGSLLASLPKIGAAHLVVLELSSYMLEYLRPMKWSPHVAVIGMIGVDHIEWHGSADAYIDAKRNIVRFQTDDDVAVLTESSADFAKHTTASVIRSPLPESRGFELTIPGKHNQQNAQLAFAAATVFGVAWGDAQKAVREFPGLPHRLQLVHTSTNGVRWFNDSIATIPAAAVAALESFPEKRVIQIVGGYDKHLDMSGLCDALSRRAKAVLTIGAIGPQIAEKIANPSLVHRCGDLAAAVVKARELADEGDIVLLSTGCASYDQFNNFEERGDLFAKLARDSR